MELEATVEDLMWTIHAHPTLAEAMLDASNSVYGMAINAEITLETRSHPDKKGIKMFSLCLGGEMILL